MLAPRVQPATMRPAYAGGGIEELPGSVDVIRWGLQGCWAAKRCPLGIAGLLGGFGAAHRKSRGSWAVKRCPPEVARLPSGGANR